MHRNDKDIATNERHGIKNTPNRAYMQRDFLEVKRNQSLQEKRDELVGTRRNFLEAKRNQRREPKQRDPRRSRQRCRHRGHKKSRLRESQQDMHKMQGAIKTSQRKGSKWSRLYNDFLKAKRNQSQQEKTRRNRKCEEKLLEGPRATMGQKTKTTRRGSQVRSSLNSSEQRRE